MAEQLLVGLSSVLILGIGARWLAWRIHLPAILLLLIFGFIAGPVSGLLDPDRMFGETLFPGVAIAVAVILFEGGLSLKVADLGKIGRAVRNLITIGVAVTWLVCTLMGHFLLGFTWPLALLFGAILVVTGPTVIMPLLRHVRPKGAAGLVVKWEGIINDPIGAVMAVLVFDAILTGGFEQGMAVAVAGLVKTILIGSGLGLIGAGFIYLYLKRNWVPDYLHNPLALTVVVGLFALSNILKHESGLLTVTLMGIALANQKSVNVKHIIEFKENLRVLLISSLFIVLAARLEPEQLTSLTINHGLFVAGLILIARPLAVLLSGFRTGLSWQEMLFVAWMAPRGIVAAAVTAVFSIDLVRAGYTEAEQFVPIMFLIIIATVAVYGLTAAPLARRLNLAEEAPQGVLIMGAHAPGRAIASSLKKAGFRVLLVDTNWENISDARLEGLPTYYGNILSEQAIDEIDLNGIGRLLALTTNIEANALAALHLSEVFGSHEVYQLAPDQTISNDKSSPRHLRGKHLFASRLTAKALMERLAQGAEIKTTKLTEAFNQKAYYDRYGVSATPMFLITGDKELLVWSEETPPSPKSGDTLISLVDKVLEKSDTPSEING